MYIFHLTHVHMNTVFRIADFARVPDQILRSPTRSGIALPIYSNTNLFFFEKKEKIPKFSEYIHQYRFAIPDPVGDRKMCQPACRQSAIPKLLLDRKICQPACRQSAPTLKENQIEPDLRSRIRLGIAKFVSQPAARVRSPNCFWIAKFVSQPAARVHPH